MIVEIREYIIALILAEGVVDPKFLVLVEPRKCEYLIT